MDELETVLAWARKHAGNWGSEILTKADEEAARLWEIERTAKRMAAALATAMPELKNTKRARHIWTVCKAALDDFRKVREDEATQRVRTAHEAREDDIDNFNSGQL